MKRLSIIATTALLLTGLTAAPAHADNVDSGPLANTTEAADQAARFWLENGGANLANATPYSAQVEVNKAFMEPTTLHPDGKLTSVPPIQLEDGKGKMPLTTGKVYFVAADGQPHWCTGSSVQSKYRNLVATAAHCVDDIRNNMETLRQWVFVPDSGAAGLYVGKQAIRHYDFTTYQDYDRDLAFVIVHNGVSLSPEGTLVDRGRLGDNVGGQGLTFNQNAGLAVDVFGYPAGLNPDGKPPYSGEVMEVSTGTTGGTEVAALKAQDLVTVDSPFTGEGGLGSAWLAGYVGAQRVGYLNGITISVVDTDGDLRYDTSLSPYFDSEAMEIYTAASNVWSGAIA